MTIASRSLALAGGAALLVGVLGAGIALGAGATSYAAATTSTTAATATSFGTDPTADAVDTALAFQIFTGLLRRWNRRWQKPPR